jgi:hypothetical protein
MERKSGTDPWRTVATATFTSTGTITFVDGTVHPGHAYEYRLVSSCLQGASGAYSLSITTPMPGKSAAAITPNPARGNQNIYLEVSGAGKVHVAAHDVAGRAILEQDVEFNDPGTSRILLPGMSGLPPGLYFLRISGTTLSTTLRITVLR